MSEGVRFNCRKCGKSASTVLDTDRWRMRLCENCFGLNIKRSNTAVYNANYHFVWRTKYRRKVLEGEIVTRCREIFSEVAKQHGWEIVTVEIMPNHVHMFVSAPPETSPSEIARYFKGVSARLLFQEFPNLKQQLWKGHLWAPSYYLGTAGNVSSEAIRRYIEEARNV